MLICYSLKFVAIFIPIADAAESNRNSEIESFILLLQIMHFSTVETLKYFTPNSFSCSSAISCSHGGALLNILTFPGKLSIESESRQIWLDFPLWQLKYIFMAAAYLFSAQSNSFIYLWKKNVTLLQLFSFLDLESNIINFKIID